METACSECSAVLVAAVAGVVLLVGAVAAAMCWRRIARLSADKLALSEQLRVASERAEAATGLLKLAEARFVELQGIKGSDSFVSLVSPAGVVGRSIRDLGSACAQLARGLRVQGEVANSAEFTPSAREDAVAA